MFLKTGIKTQLFIKPLLFHSVFAAAFCFLNISAIFAGTVLDVDFNNHNEGQYTKALLDADWKNPSWNNGVDEGRVRIVTNPSYDVKSLQVLYPALGVGPGMGGAQWQAVFNKYEELFASYYILFPDGWDGVKGGKLPGLCGAGCPTGGDTVTGYNGFSARYMFKPGMKMVVYCYHMDKPGTWGEDFALDYTFQRGVWYKLTQRIKLNTPNQKDGEIQVWVDDKEALFIDTLRFRATDTVQIDKFYFSTFYGGSTPDWAPLTDQYIYFDNFKIFTGTNTINRDDGFLMRGTNAIRIIKHISRGVVVYIPQSGGFTCRIFDLQGRLVNTPIRKSKNSGIFSVQNMSNGIYILCVCTPRGSVYKRFSVLY